MNSHIIAKRYALALFSQIKGDGKAEKIQDELDGLAELMKTSPDFANIVKNPVILAEEKEGVFAALKEKGAVSDILFDFIRLLIEKKRLFLLEDIDAEIKKLILEEKGEAEAEAVFAEPADDSIKDDLRRRLERLTGRKVLLKSSVDPSIIGGVKVRLGSVLYDATVKGRLERLKASLA